MSSVLAQQLKPDSSCGIVAVGIGGSFTWLWADELLWHELDFDPTSVWIDVEDPGVYFVEFLVEWDAEFDPGGRGYYYPIFRVDAVHNLWEFRFGPDVENPRVVTNIFDIRSEAWQRINRIFYGGDDE